MCFLISSYLWFVQILFYWLLTLFFNRRMYFVWFRFFFFCMYGLTWFVVYLGECPTCAWDKYICCCHWMDCYRCLLGLAGLRSCSFSVSLLPRYCIHCWKYGLKSPTIIFELPVSPSLLSAFHVYWDTAVGYTYAYHCHIIQ